MADTIVFGEIRICRRCGKVAHKRYRFGLSFSGQADTWAVEYCEHCRPQSAFAALVDAAVVPHLAGD